MPVKYNAWKWNLLYGSDNEWRQYPHIPMLSYTQILLLSVEEISIAMIFQILILSIHVSSPKSAFKRISKN